MQNFNQTLNHSPQIPYWEDRTPIPQQRLDLGNHEEVGVENERSLSPTLASPGLESVRDEDTDKEFIRHPDTEKEAVVYQPQRQSGSSGQRTTLCGLRRPWFFAILGALICIAIGLGVGLGVGLGRKSSGSQNVASNATSGNSTSGGSAAITPDYFSQTGAFNGTGIALASYSFSAGGYGAIDLYFQHHTGQIRSAQLTKTGAWSGGTYAEVVAVDAKNATPIAAVAYAQNDIATWHIFYIDVNNIVRERINDNTTNLWSDGPIGALNLKAMNSSKVGLQACWYGSFYGDATYNHSPVPGQEANTTGNSTDQSVGIHLWYGINDTSFNEVEWTYGSTNWTEQQVFNGFNGHAGVGCYSWGPGSVSYVFMVNLHNQVEIWWKDLNTTLKGNATHPIDTWTNSSITIPVFQNSSMGYTNYLYAQNEDLSVSGYNVSFDAEKTMIPSSETFTINGARGLPGTHLSVTTLPNPSGGNSLLAFYQVNGTDVTEYVRDLQQGQWTSSGIPIPS